MEATVQPTGDDPWWWSIPAMMVHALDSTESSTTTAICHHPQLPLVSFLAGALLPTLAFVLLRNFWQHPPPSVTIRDSNNDKDDDKEEDSMVPSSTGSGVRPSQWGMAHAPYKMILCVNQELGMGKGKIAAQCCHAALGCFQQATKACPAAVKAWERTGCAKIALKCPTQAELEDIAVRAAQAGIPCYLVEDAGRTQIAAGSRTVLGLGPAPVSVFEGITDHLKLM